VPSLEAHTAVQGWVPEVGQERLLYIVAHGSADWGSTFADAAPGHGRIDS
jgi:hypothetical protein